MIGRSKWLPLLFMGTVAAAGAAAALLWRGGGGAPELQTGTALEPRRELADFSLIDQHGLRFTRADLKSHWSMLYFGFTNCPDLCPATLATLASMERALRAAGDRDLPQVVFVSVDARRDTPARLAQYVKYFDPGFVGVTGADQAAVERVARQFGMAVAIRPQAGGGYGVDHSSAILVIAPDGRLAAILTGPFTAGALRSDFLLLAGRRAG